MFTTDEIIREIRRELQMRLRVYSGMVERGEMKQEEAARRIGIMEQILADYELAGGDRQEELRL